MFLELLDFHSEVHKEGVKTLHMLNTNIELFWNLLRLGKVDGQEDPIVDWSQFFNVDDMYKTIYVLQIVESFLNNDYATLDQKSEEAILRSDWAVRFYNKGGFT